MTSEASVASVAEQVRADVAEARDRRLHSVDRATLLKLAVVPEWTGRLAEAVLKLSSGRVDELVRRLDANSLAHVERIAAPVADPLLGPSVVGALGDLAPPEAVANVLRATKAITDASVRSQALVEVAPAVTRVLVPSALEIAGAIQGIDGARALAALIRRVPSADRATVAERVALDIQDAPPLERAELLVAVAPDLSPERRRELVTTTIQAAIDASSESSRSSILIRVAPAVPSELSDLMATAIDRVADPRAHASVLSAVALPLPELVVRLTEGDTAGDDSFARVSELAAAAVARARRGDTEGATRKADQINDVPTRSRVLARLLDELSPDADVRDAIDLASYVAASVDDRLDPFTRVAVQSQAAIALARLGDDRAARSLVAELLQARDGAARSVRGIGPLTSLALASREIGDLSGSAEAAAAALRLVLPAEDVRTRVLGVASLLPYLRPDDAKAATTAAIDATDTVADPVERARLLAALAPAVHASTIGPSVARTIDLAFTSSPRVTFWITDEVRQAVLDGASREAGSADLLKLTADVAVDVRKAMTDGLPGAPRLASWVELARRSGSPTGVADAAHWLSNEIDRALRQEDLTSAHSLAATALGVAQVVGEPLASAVRQVDRKIALVHRRENDGRHLATYLPRDDQVAAITRLLDGPNDRWALHFLGVGGVGKTMLLRYLTGRIAEDRNLLTARVDFDYLTPDYPARRPGELLLALAADLEAYVEGPYAEEKVRQLRDDVVAFHAQLAKPDSEIDQLSALKTDEFRKLIGVFQELLGAITRVSPEEPLHSGEKEPRRVVLILDTCEELAKMQPSGKVHPSVVATFDILEAIQDKVQTLRVIFSGRRLLSRSGDGWHASDSSAAGTTPLLPATKTYMGLHLVRGFDNDQARTYLRDCRHIELAAETERRLFEASRDQPLKIDVAWDADPDATEEADGEGPRVSPFDLAVHAEFADELTAGPDGAARLQDIYVERRIIGRIRPRAETGEEHQQVAGDVRSMLPAAVLLGRFDRPMLEAAGNWSPDRFETAFRELASQEWMEVQRDGSLELTFLTVDRNLLPRLRRYFAAPSRSADTDRVVESLGPALARLIERTTDVGAISVELVDSALRYLPGPPASACWDAFLHRCLANGRFDRCADVMRVALAEDGSVGSEADHPLEAAVRAVYVASLVQGRSEEDRAVQWAAIAEAADREPDLSIRRWLTQRALGFRIGSGDLDALEGAAKRLETDFLAIRRHASPAAPRRGQELAAAYVGAFEAIVERSEAQGLPIASEALRRCMAVVDNEATPRMLAFTASLRARIETSVGEYDRAERTMESAVRHAEDVPSTEGSWLDWRAPDDLLDRLRLEEARLLTRPVGHTPRRKRPAERLELPESIATIDAERLASAVLADRLTRGLVPVATLEKLAARDAYDADRVAHCNAHRSTPQLAVTLADGWLAAGDARRALDILDQRRGAAFASGMDTATSEAMDVAKVDVARRMRLAQGVVESLVDRFAASTTVALAGRALEAAALTRGGSLPSAPTLIDVAPERWWRVQATVRPEVRAAAEPPSAPTPSPEGPVIQSGPSGRLVRASFVQVSRAFDDYERARVLRAIAWTPTISSTSWGRAHPTERLEGARLAARAYMLETISVSDPSAGGSEAERAGDLRAWERVVGRRRLALITMEEAELLALRIPAAAVRGFKQAARLFRDAEDPVGQFLASTGIALALRHTGDDDERRATADHLEVVYREFLRKRTTEHLPSWAELKNAAGRSIRGPLGQLADDPWRPWVERLYVAVAWATGKPGRRRAAPVEGAEASLPTELLDLTTTPSRRARSWSFIVSVASSMFFLAAFFFILLTIATSIDTGIRLAIAAVGSMVSFLLAAVVGSSSDAVRSVTQLTLTVGPAARGGQPQLRLVAEVPLAAPDDEQEPTASQRLVLSLTRVYISLGALTWLKPAGPPNEGSALEVDAADPDDLPYGQRTSRVPADIVMELRQRLIDANARPIVLPITADRAVGGEPWEALVTLAAGSPPEATTGARQLVAYRAAEPRPGPRRGGRRTVVQVIAESGLRSVTAPWLVSPATTIVQDSEPPTSMSADILHLVGRPVQGDGEIVFDVGAPDDRRPARSLLPSAPTPSRSSKTLRLASLDLQKVALVVIQARPDDPERRAASDRRKASRLRALAAEAMAAGAETVVIVPSLPGPLADEVIGLLARTLGPITRRARVAEAVRRLYVQQLGAPTYRDGELTGWLADVRALVEGWPSRKAVREAPIDTEAYVELAFDLTICTRPGRRDATATGVSEA